MKKGNIGKILCILAWLLQLAVEGMFLLSVWQLNMLPSRYFLLALAALALLLVITGLLLLLPAGKKKTGAFEKNKNRSGGLVRRILGSLLAVIVMICCGIGWNVVSQVNSAVDGITSAAETVNVSMSVYVMADDPAQSIQDATDYTFAALEDYEAVRTEHTLDMIRNELGGEIRLEKYATLMELVDALYQGEVNALILNSAYVSILEDEGTYADFSQMTRILYTAVIEETIYRPVETHPAETEPDATQPTEEPYSITTHPFIVYISGSDTRDYYLSTSRSDVNILAVVNPETKMVLLINTPRDYYIANPAGNGAKDKLTHCGIYGIGCSVGALEGLYETDIRYYAQINFTGVETLVDAIGGIDVYSDYAFTALWYYPIQQGWNHLDGPGALAFARDRYSHSAGDNARGRNQMKVIQAVISKMTSGRTIIENYSSILGSLEGMFKTDISSQEIGELVKMQLEDMASWNIVTYAVTGAGGSDITYSMPGLYCYVMYPNERQVQYGAQLIDRVMEGEILTSDDMICPE